MTAEQPEDPPKDLEAEAGSPFSDDHPYGPLLSLQEEDLRLDRLRAHIEHHPANDEIRTLHDRSVAIDRSSEVTKLEYEKLSARQAAIESEVAEIDRRVAQIDERLSGGDSGSFRDQAAMSEEMGSLTHRKRTLEDEELDLMERLEPLDVELSAVLVAKGELQARARALHTEMLREIEGAKRELSLLESRRVGLASSLSTALVSDYERIRSRHDGVGVARLVHERCSGCNLSLSATELDRIRHANAGALFNCEQCGRILVP